ncbi:MAG: MBL fold metallo-hydrolase [Nevskiales bacterium]|nr:MBL fold metallo-hydrolase [Nevskiales bacterium]
MQLQFWGACGRVTGSCYLLSVGDSHVLIDCGMIQGSSEDEELNREPFPFDPQRIDAVVLTHAHLDHSGRLPLLTKSGYTGPIYTHQASRDLCRIMLRDAAYLNEMDARTESRKRQRRGQPEVEPLYRQADALDCMRHFRAVQYDHPVEVAPGIVARFRNAGHILGAAFVEFELRLGDQHKRITFSGDLGQGATGLMGAPEKPGPTDLMILESTYGDRIHPAWSRTVRQLRDVLEDAWKDRGVVLIPAFAVGRTQELLLLLHQHYHDWKLDRWRIHLDGPLGVQATAIYARHAGILGNDAVDFGRDSGFQLPNMLFTRTPAQSQQLNKAPPGTIIIAGAGMCNGGRIRHHLKHQLWKPETHVLLVGYQAPGTLGRRLQDGTDTVKLWGDPIHVAARIHTIHGLSAHADANHLMSWYKSCPNRPPVALTHGEPQSTEALAGAIEEQCGIRARIPRFGDRIKLQQL